VGHTGPHHGAARPLHAQSSGKRGCMCVSVPSACQLVSHGHVAGTVGIHTPAGGVVPPRRCTPYEWKRFSSPRFLPETCL